MVPGCACCNESVVTDIAIMRTGESGCRSAAVVYEAPSGVVHREEKTKPISEAVTHHNRGRDKEGEAYTNAGRKDRTDSKRGMKMQREADRQTSRTDEGSARAER